MKKNQMTKSVAIGLMLFLFKALGVNAQNQIPSWIKSDSIPSLSGSATLSINITPDRTEAVVPAGIFFQHDGPLSDYYYWDFGNGIKERGSQSSHIYEIPGTYKVKVIRVNSETMAWGKDSVYIVISNFSGTTYFIDSLNGNNSNSGTSPANAWKTAGKAASFVRNGNESNVRFLFKRGMVFPVDSSDFSNGNLFRTTSANIFRIGAYANNDGSDDTTLSRPIIKINSAGIPPENAIYGAFGNNNYDAVLYDIHFQGDYVYVAPPNDPLTRQDYPVLLTNIIDFKNFSYLRLEISKLGNGGYFQNNMRGVFIHHCNFHHIQATPVYGNVKWYSLRNNSFSYIAQSHMHYLGPNEGVIRDNNLKENGQSVNVGRDPWYQVGIRLNSSINSQVRRVYIARNYVTQMTGTPLTVGQNNDSDPSSEELVVEENIFCGNAPEESFDYWTVAPIASFQSVTGLVFRNNAIINARAGILVNRNGTINQNLNFTNNTFHLTDANAATINLAGNSGDVLDISIKQNICIGSSLGVALNNAAFEPELYLSDNVFWNNGSNVQLKIAGIYSDIISWNTINQGKNNKIVNPQLESLIISDEDFILPGNHSADMRSSLEMPLYDFTGSLRSDDFIGAREYVEASPVKTVNVKADKLEILASPNPFTEFTIITVPEEYNGKFYSLVNLSGQLLLSGIVKGNIQINKEKLSGGTYLLSIDGIKPLKLLVY